MNTSSRFWLMGLILVLSTVLFSCIDDSVPPQLPSVQTFDMDFSQFGDEEKSGQILFQNWLYSSATVAVFSTYASLSMVIPVAAYEAALVQTPEYLGDHQWLWSYAIPLPGVSYTARLTGTVMSRDRVKWEMKIDKTGLNAFTDFLWFEGTSTDSTRVEWTIYENPASPSEVIKINWTKEKTDTNSALKYTLTRNGDKQYNSTIEAGSQSGVGLDYYYKIYRSDEDCEIAIEWNSLLGSGRVKSPYFYKDESWHCWNNYHLDDFCE